MLVRSEIDFGSVQVGDLVHLDDLVAAMTVDGDAGKVVVQWEQEAL